jgi:hypothetical protein
VSTYGGVWLSAVLFGSEAAKKILVMYCIHCIAVVALQCICLPDRTSTFS